MASEWVSIERVAEALHVTVAEAEARAERERWPRVFRLHGTLVLPPASLMAP